MWSLQGGKISPTEGHINGGGKMRVSCACSSVVTVSVGPFLLRGAGTACQKNLTPSGLAGAIAVELFEKRSYLLLIFESINQQPLLWLVDI